MQAVVLLDKDVMPFTLQENFGSFFIPSSLPVTSQLSKYSSPLLPYPTSLLLLLKPHHSQNTQIQPLTIPTLCQYDSYDGLHVLSGHNRAAEQAFDGFRKQGQKPTFHHYATTKFGPWQATVLLHTRTNTILGPNGVSLSRFVHSARYDTGCDVIQPFETDT